MRGPERGASSFDEFVHSHSGTLFATAVLLTGNRDRGEELLQDTLTALYPKWDLVRGAEQPVAYVRRSLTNRFLNTVRSTRREVLAWEIPDSWDGRDLAERVVASRTVWQLLGELGERQRAAVVLRYFHDLDDHEIAADLGCRRGTARSLISRGLAAMRERLHGDSVDSSDLGAQR